MVFITPSAFAADGQDKSGTPSERVVVFSLPRVTWETLREADTPHIDTLISRGSVAAMSVRAISVATTPAQGYVTLSAGNRGTAADPTRSTFLRRDEMYYGEKTSTVFQRQRGDIPNKTAALGISFELTRRSNLTGRYNSRVGLFAQSLHAHGKSVAVFGNADECLTDSPECFDRSIAYFAADTNGIVRSGDISRDLLSTNNDQHKKLTLDNKIMTSKVKTSLEKNDVLIVECSDLERIERARRETKQSVSAQDFREAIEKCDELVGKILPSLTMEHDQVYLLSPSAPKVQEQTTIFIAAGKDIPRGYASSATTRWSGVVTLVDIAPTILTSLGVPLPEKMNNTLLDWDKNTLSSESRMQHLVTMNDQAVVRDNSIKSVRLFLVLAMIVSMLIAMVAFTRGGKWRTIARFLLLMAASIPTLSFLLKPLYISLEDSARIIAVLVVLSSMAAVLCMRIARKWGTLHLILGFAAVNLTVFITDILLGGYLQFSSIFGNSPVTAGRFAGFGNSTFAIVAITSIIIVAIVKELTGSKDSQTKKKINIALIAFLIAILVIDGVPYYGSDVGGVLALTPTIFIIGMMLFDRRFGWKSFFLSSFITVGAITVFAFLDLARPVSQRTHLGRFAESVMDGSAGVIVERKLMENMRAFQASSLSLIVLVSIFYILFIVFYRDRIMKKSKDTYPGLRFLLFPGLIVAILGMALNDSGVAIPAMMFAFAIPAISLLALEPATQDVAVDEKTIEAV